ncbi:hypothetical protein [Clostridium botulinum]|uniref:hypothetical protein n=1 Tax=Clostridium botulinum TaxID=1491 RepID=UPI0004DB1FA9|nr:hypothetical protein [Clostridium botulinum]KEH92451.1 hypothetical protein Z963_05610 [Clostridium botulinum C/D str. It1]
MCILAKYEPASNVGKYSWDYKLEHEYSALDKINMCLIELEDLKEFTDKHEKHYYAIAPLKGYGKIRRKLKEKQFIKCNWSKIDFFEIQEELKNSFEPIEDRVTSYYFTEINKDTKFDYINNNYLEWDNLYIVVSEKELSSYDINNMFSQIYYFNRVKSNSLFDYLILKNIGFINLDVSFFHEEYSHENQRCGKGEKILMYYYPRNFK